jgi:serine/threonine protein kinase
VTGHDEPNGTLVALHPAAANTGHALPIGWRLHEFEIESTLGDGGFGIVYLARDLQLKRQVAIKELMPNALASRRPGMSVAVKADRFRAAFEAGQRIFINEAQLLAQFDHPALVKVYRFWEENGTAYMVMPYYRGKTLSQWLKSQSEGPSEEALLPLIRSLLEALERLHSQSVFHRDIAPDNVLLLETGRPLLLDFGSARRIIGDMTQALTVLS